MIPIAVVSVVVIRIAIVRIDIIPIDIIRIAVVRTPVIVTASVVPAVVAVAVGNHAAEQRAGDKCAARGPEVVVPMVVAVAAITPVPAVPNLDDIGLSALCPGHEDRRGINWNRTRKYKSCDEGGRYA